MPLAGATGGAPRKCNGNVAETQRKRDGNVTEAYRNRNGNMTRSGASRLCFSAVPRGPRRKRTTSKKQAKASNKQATSKQQASNKQATSKQQASNKQATSKQNQANAITLKTRAPGIEPTQPRSQVRIRGRWAAHGDATITARLRVPSSVVNLWRVGGMSPTARLSPRVLRQNGNHKNVSPPRRKPLNNQRRKPLKNVPCHDGNHKQTSDGNRKNCWMMSTTENISKNVLTVSVTN